MEFPQAVLPGIGVPRLARDDRAAAEATLREGKLRDDESARSQMAPLLRYSLANKKKCDNSSSGRNSHIYVTLRKTFCVTLRNRGACAHLKLVVCLMPVTQIPSRDPQIPPNDSPEQRDLFEAQHWETAYRGFNPDDVPHLLIQLQDDLSRTRKREALWLSVILHLFVIILLWNAEKLMGLLPHRTVNLAIQADKSKDATFLELPPDEQKLTRRPDAKVLSDKDRIATSKAPQINREDLKKILESARPGHPGAMTPQPPAPSQPPPQQAQNQQAPATQQAPQQQAFAQITRAHARWIERLDYFEDF